MKLSDYVAQGRDNNFNLIRLVAALSVLVTHSFAIATGNQLAEPLRDSLGLTMGDIAVDVFFTTSGFLVTASLLVRQSFIEFVWARALRIYPALWVMLLLTVFGLGVFFTTKPLSVYFTTPQTYVYVAKCAVLFFGLAYNLPGVFEANIYPGAVNGSLWSMASEVRLYAILVLGWLALRLVREHRITLFKAMVVGFAGLAGVAVLILHLRQDDAGQFPRLFYMFFAGSAFYVLRHRITVSPWLVLALSLALIATIGNTFGFVLAYLLSIQYLLFYLAYVPAGFIRHYNKLGDYSYGIYIYAFPVQQSISALMPGISILKMTAIAMPLTILLAVLSWHLLEKHALSYKDHYVGHTKNLRDKLTLR